MQENWYELMETVQRKQELERVLACNEKTKSFGLTHSLRKMLVD